MNHDQSKHQSWHTGWPDHDGPGSPATVTVLVGDADTIDTGLLDAAGRPIHRRVKHPAGFIDFEKVRGQG